MLFFTREYLALVIFCLLAAKILSTSWRPHLLLVCSLVFYGSWDPRYLVLLIGGSALTHGCALASHRKLPWALPLGVIGNLSLLGFFKYGGFITENLNVLLQAMGQGNLPAPSMLLPVGISFFTFQNLSYLLDVSKGRLEPERSFPRYLLYISFFPQLVAGPIVRFQDFSASIRAGAGKPSLQFHHALRFFVGWAKKTVLADSLAGIADASFSGNPGAIEAWTGLLAYAFQIYFDFSGYSDMALASASAFGFNFPENFNHPYRAKSLQEFWKRWHISLSSFLRDYLYIPLGGNRSGPARTMLNLIITMALGGLWHGAAWHFVAWGLWHGVFLAIARHFPKAPLFLAWPTTFLVVLCGWVFFRAPHMQAAMSYFSSMAGCSSLGSWQGHSGILLILAGSLVWLISGIRWDWDRTQRWPAWLQGVALGGLWALIHAVKPETTNPFVYFQF